MSAFMDFIFPWAFLSAGLVAGILAIKRRRTTIGFGMGRCVSTPLFSITLKGSPARILGVGYLAGSGIPLLILAACLMDGGVNKDFLYSVPIAGVFSGVFFGLLFAAVYAVYDFLR